MDRLAARPRRCPGGLRPLPVVSVGAPAPEGKPPFTEQFPYPGSPSAADLRGPGGANAAFPEMRGARGPRQPRGLRDPGPARPRPPLLKAPHPQLSGLEPPSPARLPAASGGMRRAPTRAQAAPLPARASPAPAPAVREFAAPVPTAPRCSPPAGRPHEPAAEAEPASQARPSAPPQPAPLSPGSWPAAIRGSLPGPGPPHPGSTWRRFANPLDTHGAHCAAAATATRHRA